MAGAAVLLLLVLYVACANGANDTFRRGSTLFGAGTADYRLALGWGTLATLAGAITALFFAGELIRVFSGKGLVPDAVVASPVFVGSVAAGAASTVLLATIFSFPVSTTHALTGALVGAGFIASSGRLDFAPLGANVFLPLLLSPLAAVVLTTVLCLPSRLVRGAPPCVCVSRPEARVAGGSVPVTVVLAWIVTLPVSAILAGTAAALF